jgi:protein-S-isoprenylcysteine O-methyltransferase Ste14
VKQRLNRDGIRIVLAPFWVTIISIVVFILAAGRMDIFKAWLVFGINFVGSIVVAILLWKFAPGLANQRGSVREGTKTWDRVILIIYFSLTFLVAPIIAGLDVGRFKWSQLGVSYAVGGIALYTAFYFLFHWAMLINEHFEGTSRIQDDRGHKVIMNGPYSFVRHPGYIAMMFTNLAYSFTIGSLYSLIPSVSAIIAIVVRTFLEDRMLQNELEGYSEYAKKTKYRLLPGIW